MQLVGKPCDSIVRHPHWRPCFQRTDRTETVAVAATVMIVIAVAAVVTAMIMTMVMSHGDDYDDGDSVAW